MKPRQALIFAAGEAKRMRPLTDHLPKPLLTVNHSPLLTHIIDHLSVEGVERIVINGWHAIEPLKQYIGTIKQAYPNIDFYLSEETELLDTGGGAVQALQYLRMDEPLYMINGDAYWINDNQSRTLVTLANQWETIGGGLSMLLLLQPSKSMSLTSGVGDYSIDNGKATRNHDKNGDYMFAGVRICHPDLIARYHCEKFSFLKIMDDAETNGNLYGIRHKGEWHHISTPPDLTHVNETLFGITA